MPLNLDLEKKRDEEEKQKQAQVKSWTKESGQPAIAPPDQNAPKATTSQAKPVQQQTTQTQNPGQSLISAVNNLAASVMTPLQALLAKRDEQQQASKWYRGDQPTGSEVMAQIYRIGEQDPMRGSQLLHDYQVYQNDPTCPWYNPYTQSTNQAVQQMAALGFDMSGGVTQQWINDNAWLKNYYRVGVSGTPLAPSNTSSAYENAAYWYYKILQDEDVTQKAEQEWAALQQEIAYWTGRTDRNYSDDEILEKINWKNYSTLTGMDAAKRMGTPMSLNRAIGYNKDDLRGVIYAARNGKQYDAMDGVRYELGQGKAYQADSSKDSRRTPGTDSYSPYSVGSTKPLDDAALYFGVENFDKDWLEQNKALMNSNDETARKYYKAVYDAEQTTLKAEAELAQMMETIDRRIKYAKEPVASNILAGLLDDAPTLRKMDESLKKGEDYLLATTRAIPYKWEEIERMVKTRCMNKRANTRSEDYLNGLDRTLNLKEDIKRKAQEGFNMAAGALFGNREQEEEEPAQESVSLGGNGQNSITQRIEAMGGGGGGAPENQPTFGFTQIARMLGVRSASDEPVAKVSKWLDDQMNDMWNKGDGALFSNLDDETLEKLRDFQVKYENGEQVPEQEIINLSRDVWRQTSGLLAAENIKTNTPVIPPVSETEQAINGAKSAAIDDAGMVIADYGTNAEKIVWETAGRPDFDQYQANAKELIDNGQMDAGQAYSYTLQKADQAMRDDFINVYDAMQAITAYEDAQSLPQVELTLQYYKDKAVWNNYLKDPASVSDEQIATMMEAWGTQLLDEPLDNDGTLELTRTIRYLEGLQAQYKAANEAGKPQDAYNLVNGYLDEYEYAIRLSELAEGNSQEVLDSLQDTMAYIMNCGNPKTEAGYIYNLQKAQEEYDAAVKEEEEINAQRDQRGERRVTSARRVQAEENLNAAREYEYFGKRQGMYARIQASDDYKAYKAKAEENKGEEAGYTATLYKGVKPSNGLSLVPSENDYNNALQAKMTEDERTLYNYLKETRGDQAAEEYYTYLSYDLGERLNEDLDAAAQKAASEGGFLGRVALSVDSVINNLFSIRGLVDIYSQKLFSDNPINTNTYGTYFSHMTGAEREAVMDNITWMIGKFDAADFLYSTGMSWVDSFLMQKFSSGIGAGLASAGVSAKAAKTIAGIPTAIMMSSSASMSRMEELKNRGATESQMLAGGFISGLCESLFEYVSLEHFLQATPKGKVNFLKIAAAHAGVEASEEIFTELGTALGDDFFIGDQSDFQYRTKQYYDQGYSLEDAKYYAMMDGLMQVAQAGASGGIMGALSGPAAYKEAKSNKANSQAQLAEKMGVMTERDASEKYSAITDRINALAESTSREEAEATVLEEENITADELKELGRMGNEKNYWIRLGDQRSRTRPEPAAQQEQEGADQPSSMPPTQDTRLGERNQVRPEAETQTTGEAEQQPANQDTRLGERNQVRPEAETQAPAEEAPAQQQDTRLGERNQVRPEAETQAPVEAQPEQKQDTRLGERNQVRPEAEAPAAEQPTTAQPRNDLGPRMTTREEKDLIARQTQALTAAVGADTTSQTVAVAVALSTDSEGSMGHMSTVAAQNMVSEEGGDKAMGMMRNILLIGANNGMSPAMVKIATSIGVLGKGQANMAWRAMSEGKVTEAGVQAMVDGAQQDLQNAQIMADVEQAIRTGMEAAETLKQVANGALKAAKKTADELLKEARTELDNARKNLADREQELAALGKQMDALRAELMRSTGKAIQSLGDDSHNLANEMIGKKREVDAAQDHFDSAEAALANAKANSGQIAEDAMLPIREQSQQNVQQKLETEQQAAEAKRQAEAEQAAAEQAQAEADEMSDNVGSMNAEGFIEELRARGFDPNSAEAQKVRDMANNLIRAAKNQAENSITFAKQVAQKFGMNVIFADTTNGGKRSRQNGFWDAETNTIVLDKTATVRDAVYAVLGHELTHVAEKAGTYGEMAMALLKLQYKNITGTFEDLIKGIENGTNKSSLAATILARQQLYNGRFAEMREQDSTFQANDLDVMGAAQEVVADIMGSILNGDRALAQRLVGESPSVARRIIDSIKSFLNRLGGTKGQWKNDVQKAIDMLESALKEAQGQQEGQAKYQISTVDNANGAEYDYTQTGGITNAEQRGSVYQGQGADAAELAESLGRDDGRGNNVYDGSRPGRETDSGSAEGNAWSDGQGDGGRQAGLRLLSQETHDKLKEQGVTDLALRRETDRQRFSSALAEGRASNENGVYVDNQSPEDLERKGAVMILSEDGLAGAAIGTKDNENGNIFGVFKNAKSTAQYASTGLMVQAIAEGGTKLDCYAGKKSADGLVHPARGLAGMYAQTGFIPVARVTFVDGINPEWNTEKFGRPPVVFWMHNGDSADVVASKLGLSEADGGYHIYTDEELMNLPLFDDATDADGNITEYGYDRAWEYRDQLLAEAENSRDGKKYSLPLDQALEDLTLDDLLEYGDFDGMDEQQAQTIVTEAVQDIKNEYDPTIYNGKVYLKPETLQQWLSPSGYASTNQNYAQAYITTMNPSDFLRITTTMAENQQRLLDQTETLNKEQLAEYSKDQPIRLYIDEATGEITGHEGRHRSIALARAGVTQMPVLLFDSSTKYSKQHHDTMTLRGQSPAFDDTVRNGNTITFNDVTPLSQGNADQIMQQYTASAEDEAAAASNGQSVLKYSLPSDNELESMLREYIANGGVLSRNTTPPGTGLPGPVRTRNQGARQRQFGSRTAQQSDALHQEVRDHLRENSDYDPDTNRAQIDRSIDWVQSHATEHDQTGFFGAMQEAQSPNFNYMSADGQARMLTLMSMAALNDDTASEMLLADMYNEQGTQIGQALQARRIFRLMTPLGRRGILLQEMNRINDQYGDRTDNPITLSDDLLDDASNARTEQEFNDVRRRARRQLAEQIPPNWREKLRGWRMMSMLANPRTHLRNVFGNLFFVPAIKLKNAIGTGLEAAARNRIESAGEQRTKAVRHTRDAIEFARQDAQTMRDVLTGERRWDAQTEVERDRRIFGTGDGLISRTLGRATQAVSDYSSRKLESEDWAFLHRHYESALAGWMQANHMTAADMQANPEMLQRARTYAINEAQKATYRDANRFASLLSRISREGGALGWAVDAVLPFKKTPANILRRGIEYSPIGLLRALTTDWRNVARYTRWVNNGAQGQMPRGAISVTQHIDRIAAGLTGTAISALGALLAHMGVITVSLDDDKDDEFAERAGEQKYSLKFSVFGHDLSYTIDWAAPSSMPFFVGATLYEVLTDENEDADIGDIIDSLVGISEPIFNLSMLEGVNNLFRTNSFGGNQLTQIGENVLANYVSSYVPTIVGQVSRTIDPTRRMNYVESGASMPVWRRLFEQIQNKTPWSVENIPYRDVWGRESRSSTWEAAFENFISPGYISEIKPTELDQEMQKLYDLTQDTSFVPKDAGKTLSVNGETVKLTDKQYDSYVKTRGETAYDLLNQLIKDPSWSQMDVGVKADIVSDAWKYANAIGRTTVFPQASVDAWIAEGMASGDPASVILNRRAELIRKDTISGYNQAVANAVRDNDMDTLTTSIEALRQAGQKDSTIKGNITKVAKPLFQEAVKMGTDEGYARADEIMAMLMSLGLGYKENDIIKWAK